MPIEYHHIKQYEKEIFRLKDQGLSQRQIGDNLGIPYKGLFCTVRTNWGSSHFSHTLYTYFLSDIRSINFAKLFICTYRYCCGCACCLTGTYTNRHYAEI